MRILLWHGYLLTGSGSNVYTANVAQALRSMGHEVMVLCQDRRAERLPFVDAVGRFDPANESYSLKPLREGEAKAEERTGRCTVVCPDIGEILPVYVLDAYAGFTAKLFVDLTDQELDFYTERNVAAFVSLTEAFDPEAIVTGHEVMGPAIARRALDGTGREYVAKLHGSALEFTVKRQERYRKEAVYGLGGAKAVVGGSRYMVLEAASVVPGWEERAAVVNPGCDVELFRQADETKTGAEATVGFVGKLITNKGAQDLIAALTLVEQRPVRLIVVGDGSFRATLEDLAAALKRADLPLISSIVDADASRHLTSFASFLEAHDPMDLARRMEGVDIHFRGHLEHGPLARVLPTFDVLVVPSIVPEAFGMVAAEAAACGVLPVVPDHSGIAEAGAAVETAIGRPGMLTFDHSRPVEGIAARVSTVLQLPSDERFRLGRAAAELARQRWSWARVADRLVELAAG